MKEYCVDLEIAKELKENGFPQNSYWIWKIDHCSMLINNEVIDECASYYFAPLSEEILKELPVGIKGESAIKYELKINIYSDTYLVSYYDYGYEIYLNQTEDKKLSNALANMWLYLKKEGYIK